MNSYTVLGKWDIASGDCTSAAVLFAGSVMSPSERKKRNVRKYKHKNFSVS